MPSSISSSVSSAVPAIAPPAASTSSPIPRIVLQALVESASPSAKGRSTIPSLDLTLVSLSIFVSSGFGA